MAWQERRLGSGPPGWDENYTVSLFCFAGDRPIWLGPKALLPQSVVVRYISQFKHPATFACFPHLLLHLITMPLVDNSLKPILFSPKWLTLHQETHLAHLTVQNRASIMVSVTTGYSSYDHRSSSQRLHQEFVCRGTANISWKSVQNVSWQAAQTLILSPSSLFLSFLAVYAAKFSLFYQWTESVYRDPHLIWNKWIYRQKGSTKAPFCRRTEKQEQVYNVFMTNIISKQ